MKKIFLLSTILLFISCGREKKVEDTESFEWGKVEMSQEMRDSLFLLGKYCIPSYDSTQIYYEP